MQSCVRKFENLLEKEIEKCVGFSIETLLDLACELSCSFFCNENKCFLL